jgi:uncharacterized iron-regulated membrane protein
LFVFSDDIMELWHHNIAYVEPQKDPIPVEAMLETLKKTYPHHRIVNVTCYKEQDRALKFLVANKQTGLLTVFIDPYTGKITGDSRCAYFFFIVAHLHAGVLLGDTGEWVVKIATIIFLLELISGLVIWLPKRLTYQNLKRLLTFKSGASSLRRQLDYHTIYGAWFLLLLLVITVSGLCLAFQPLGNTVSKSFGGDPSVKVTGGGELHGRSQPIRTILNKALVANDVYEAKLRLFDYKTSSVYQIVTGKKTGILTYQGTNRIFDKYTGNEIMNRPAQKHADVQNWIMRIHTGVWLGWLGKILTFFAGLVGSLLSVTGIAIWWKKRY